MEYWTIEPTSRVLRITRRKVNHTDFFYFETQESIDLFTYQDAKKEADRLNALFPLPPSEHLFFSRECRLHGPLFFPAYHGLPYDTKALT